MKNEAWVLELMVIITALTLISLVTVAIVIPSKSPRIVEIKNIEAIIKEGSFIYNDGKYSVKKIDEKVWKSNLKEIK